MYKFNDNNNLNPEGVWDKRVISYTTNAHRFKLWTYKNDAVIMPTNWATNIGKDAWTSRQNNETTASPWHQRKQNT
jgi:hypothetical protein